MEKEKGFRIVPCPNCGKRHRIKVGPEHYGKTVELECANTPACRTRFRTTIPIPETSTGQEKSSGFEFLEEAAFFFQSVRKK